MQFFDIYIILSDSLLDYHRELIKTSHMIIKYCRLILRYLRMNKCRENYNKIK